MSEYTRLPEEYPEPGATSAVSEYYPLPSEYHAAAKVSKKREQSSRMKTLLAGSIAAALLAAGLLGGATDVTTSLIKGTVLSPYVEETVESIIEEAASQNMD